jgi:hypothetical protein
VPVRRAANKCLQIKAVCGSEVDASAAQKSITLHTVSSASEFGWFLECKLGFVIRGHENDVTKLQHPHFIDRFIWDEPKIKAFPKAGALPPDRSQVSSIMGVRNEPRASCAVTL